ncbi:MAG: type II secretion system protein E [Candidatus Kaiserbacteria bacterium GW2011_GWB1_52_6]|uniref:Type II secretion system protein E n=2 Tax=Candidatus Kaiseribacteriota TaxID=1752734 RepID=A0A0G1X972_9BACT|nr:MAG: type II secretion system protein E [Candidatus Kaiserbacteria bacterium GW2011_GWA2_52_12]KKW27748.1 MAG: type II secretion system protein E [Candidatus Kaiserbacteria bacterium GW2011_GWB1_52_6]
MVSGAPSTAAKPTSEAIFEAPRRTIGDTKIPYDVLRYVPQESADHYKFAPLGVVDGVLEVGMVDPDNIQAIDALNFIARATGMPFKVFQISEQDLEKVFAMYRGLGGTVDQAITDLESEQQAAPIGELENVPLDLDDPTIARNAAGIAGKMNIQEDAPTIKIVSTILRYAIDGKASDVHIEPMPSGVRVRYRVDGDLHTSIILPLNTHRTIVARIKVLSAIRLDEMRKPQDGRFSASIENHQIDFRVSTFPSYYGEKIVMRILDRRQGFIPLDEIGLSERAVRTVRDAVTKPHGLILVSGPTGSGKSTTLYSLLSEMDRETKNVLSLEDPIEYFVDGVSQSQMRPEIGYTFASGLRTTLRQDPDIIMVGEIRDSETAKLAIQAALTGHLVLSTIHTNDAVGTIPRLIDMGVEPYLIPPVLILSIAQRLVRTFSEGGAKEFQITPSIKKSIEAGLETLPERHRFKVPPVAYEPMPTSTNPSGLRGRMAVFEVLEMSSDVEKIILENPVESQLWTAARAQGMLTMQEDAMLKSFAKKIPYSEVSALSTLLAGEEEEVAAVASGVSPEEAAIPVVPITPKSGKEKQNV